MVLCQLRIQWSNDHQSNLPMRKFMSTFLHRILLVILPLSFFSCEKDKERYSLEMAEPPSDIITQINHPPNFNTCHGNFNLPPDRPWGWIRVQLNDRWYYGVAAVYEVPVESNHWELSYVLLNYESCLGSYWSNLSNVPLALDDPRHDWDFVPYYYVCSDTFYRPTLEEGQRATLFDVLNHDTALQIMVADTTPAYRTRLVIDQVDTVAGFVRGRFAARFYANPECDPDEMLESEVLLENGYFEASFPYR